MVDITDRALIKARELIFKNPKYRKRMMRIYIVGDEFERIEYGIAFDAVNHGDVVYRIKDDFRIVLSGNCSRMLENGVIDYIENDDGAGFVVYNANEVSKNRRWSQRQH